MIKGNAYFSDVEASEALQRVGYTVEKVEAFIQVYDRDDGIIHIPQPVIIAYKGTRPEEAASLKPSEEKLKNEFGLQVVFSRELKARILSKLFPNEK